MRSIGQMLGQKSAGGVEILGKGERKILEQNARIEDVLFCLKGNYGQALVCTADRILIIKRGVVATHSALGSMATSFYYRDIMGLEIRRFAGLGGLAALEITTPSYAQARLSKHSDANGQPHCLPVTTPLLTEFAPYLERLRSLMAEAKAPVVLAAPVPQANLGSQVEHLAALHASGVLSDAEFAQAKARVLS